MKVTLLSNENEIVEETNMNKFERGIIIDLDANGACWEGDCLEWVPFGFGCFYNCENEFVVKYNYLISY